DRYRQALEGLRERCAQEAERITARRRAVAAMSNNEAVKPCAVAAAIRKIDMQQYYECAAREIERLRADAEGWRALGEMDGGEIYALLGDCDGIHPDQADAAIDAAMEATNAG